MATAPPLGFTTIADVRDLSWDEVEAVRRHLERRRVEMNAKIASTKKRLREIEDAERKAKTDIATYQRELVAIDQGMGVLTF